MRDVIPLGVKCDKTRYSSSLNKPTSCTALLYPYM